MPNIKKSKLRVKLLKPMTKKRLLPRRRARMVHQLSGSEREPGNYLSTFSTLKLNAGRMTKFLKRSLISSKIESFNLSLERLQSFKTKPRIQSVPRVPEI